MQQFDVVVVGGSISGTLAAISAAERGLSVVLLERKKFPGEKVFCAEGISQSSYHYFFEKNPRWISTEINQVSLFSPSGRKVKIETPGAGYILERRVMERDLWVIAAEKGAELRCGVRVLDIGEWDGEGREVVTSDGKVWGRIVVGADGIESLTGRKTGLVRGLYPGEYHATLQYFAYHPSIEEDTAELHAGPFAPGGYGWVFPKGKGYGWVGIGVDTAKKSGNLRDLLKEFIRKRFGNLKIIFISGGGVPTTPLKKRTTDGVILVGDAGRFAIPVSGGGISHALYTGKLAGEVASEVLEKGPATAKRLSIFDKRWKREWGKEEKWYFIAKKIYMRMKDEDFEILYDVVKKLFEGKKIREFHPFEAVERILKASPHLLKLGKKLLGGYHGI